VDTKHVVLHRYFIWADLMRADLDRWIRSEQKHADPTLDGFTYLVTPGGTYMSLWYAALYVVVEGWRELRLKDATIDRLLASGNTDLLRRYRHGVCHFQQGWLDARLEQFFASKDSAAWVRELHSALGAYFLVMYPPERPRA
jgi:hypothetical protein